MGYLNGSPNFAIHTLVKGDSVFIRFSSQADGTDYTKTWNTGQNYLGIATGLSAPEDKSGYQWQKLNYVAGDFVPRVVNDTIYNKVYAEEMNNGGIIQLLLKSVLEQGELYDTIPIRKASTASTHAGTFEVEHPQVNPKLADGVVNSQYSPNHPVTIGFAEQRYALKDEMQNIDLSNINLSNLGVNILAEVINSALNGYVQSDASIDSRFTELEGKGLKDLNISVEIINKALAGYSVDNSSINNRLQALEEKKISLNELSINPTAEQINVALSQYSTTDKSIKVWFKEIEGRLSKLEGGDDNTGGGDNTGGDDNTGGGDNTGGDSVVSYVYCFACGKESVDADYVMAQTPTEQESHKDISVKLNGLNYIYYIYPDSWGGCTFKDLNDNMGGVTDFSFDNMGTLTISDVEYRVYRSSWEIEEADDYAKIRIY